MPTILLTHGRCYATGSPTAAHPTAMAVTGGVIDWLGPDDAGRARYPEADVVDLAGAFVAPAFVDAHVHATSTGLALDGLDLSKCRSLGECLAALRDFAVSGAGVVWGHGWDETTWPEGRAPGRAEIDAVVGDRPVYLSRVDVHSAVVSTALVELAPGAVGTPGWSPAGPLSQAAHHHTRGAARAALTPEQRRAAQTAFLRHAASLGVAAVHECAGPDISGTDDLADLLASDAGPEVVGYWGQPTDPALAAALGARGLAGDLFIDGAIGSRTASLRTPYTDDPHNHGAAYLSANQIAEHLVNCTRAGIQAGFHVIGDAGVAALVAGFTAAQQQVGTAALAARRHRVEHLEMVDAEQAAALGGWGVIGSVQPAFDAAWGGRAGMYALRLGPDRGSALNPFSVLAASGVTLAFGSDSPVTPVDPWGGVRAAVHHRTPGFGVSPGAAFAAHTRAGWHAAGDDDGHGVLAPGAPATYAIWDTGQPPGHGLPDLAPGRPLPVCLRTVLRGETIFDAGVLR